MQMYGEMTALRAAVEASKNLPAAIIVGPWINYGRKF
jgi:hypothetical protein